MSVPKKASSQEVVNYVQFQLPAICIYELFDESTKKLTYTWTCVFSVLSRQWKLEYKGIQILPFCIMHIHENGMCAFFLYLTDVGKKRVQKYPNT